MADEQKPWENQHSLAAEDIDVADPDTDGTGDPTDPIVQAELRTLEAILRQPKPKDPYADESGYHRVVELVAAIGRDPSFDPDATRPAAWRTDAVGLPLQTIGHYQLLAKLGEGGMGAVYKALHTRLRKVVALKLLPAQRLRDEAAVARFDREMQAVGQLDHPNIVAAHDAGEIDGNHYPRHGTGRRRGPVDARRRLGPLPIPAACELIRQAAVGLQHAHERGFVHRDIKPSNLMLATSGQQSAVSDPSSAFRTPHSALVKILDLGLALLDPQRGDQARNSPRPAR